MCTVTLFRHRDCGHMWAVVTEQCVPDMGFSTCASFEAGDAAKAAPRVWRTRRRACPRCGGVAYDANEVRVVERMG